MCLRARFSGVIDPEAYSRVIESLSVRTLYLLKKISSYSRPQSRKACGCGIVVKNRVCALYESWNKGKSKLTDHKTSDSVTIINLPKYLLVFTKRLIFLINPPILIITYIS